MNIFKRLFGGKQPVKAASPSPPNTETDIQEKSLAEVITCVRSLEESVPVKSMIPLYRRLFEIGMFEHGLTDDERRIACSLADRVKVDILKGMEGQPANIEAFLEAADDHADKVQFYGYGSLQWIMDEHDIGADELIPFACMAEFEELLPSYLTMLPDDVMIQVRGEFLRNLIRARRESEDQSDVRALHSLLLKSDRAAEILLRSDEIKTIRNMPHDYESAEKLVAFIVNSNC